MTSEVGPITRLLLKRPAEAFQSAASIEAQWRTLGYPSPPDLEQAQREYAGFVTLLEAAGAELHFLPADPRTGLDSIYVRDASVHASRGMILGNMGKAARRDEPAAQAEAFGPLGIPVCGEIRDPGLLEGGDVVWLDEGTVAVGCGYRTNEEGIRQLAALLDDMLDELLVVPLPHWRGPGDVLHLMSLLSPIDRDLALVHSPLLPVPFREALLGRGIELVDIAAAEFASLACNVLAVRPRVCLMVAGNPVTRDRLRAAGVEVHEFEGGEIALKGGGGPTCLTRPLARGAG